MKRITPTERALNLLFIECADDYGSMSYTYRAATLKNIEAFRLRDLFILRATDKYTPKMYTPAISNIRAIYSLGIHASKMNTLEGFRACFELMASHFPDGSLSRALRSNRAAIENGCGQRWINKFGINPIRPEDYSSDVVITVNRPLPSMPELSQ